MTRTKKPAPYSRLTVYLVHKWRCEGMSEPAIAQVLSRSLWEVQELLLEPLTKNEWEMLCCYYRPAVIPIKSPSASQKTDDRPSKGVTDKELEQILAMWRMGYSHAAIGDALGMSRSKVGYWIYKSVGKGGARRWSPQPDAERAGAHRRPENLTHPKEHWEAEEESNLFQNGSDSDGPANRRTLWRRLG